MSDLDFSDVVVYLILLSLLIGLYHGLAYLLGYSPIDETARSLKYWWIRL